MFRRLLTIFCALALSSLAPAQPLTTAFTFQGQLNSAGSPVSGTYDLQFRLFDAASAGAQIGPTLCSDNLSLANGTFTTQLDFGAQFSGQQRFLEVSVRQDTGLSCSNATGFTTLSPRQLLSAAPNSIYSLSAASATSAATATNATQLNGQTPAFYQNAANLNSGFIPSDRLAGPYTSAVTMSNGGNAFTGFFTGNGAGLTSIPWSGITGAPASVLLQPTSPGLPQTGNLNVSGIVEAGDLYAAAAVHPRSAGGTGDVLSVSNPFNSLPAGLSTEAGSPGVLNPIINLDANFHLSGVSQTVNGGAVRIDTRPEFPTIQFLTRLFSDGIERTPMSIASTGQVAIGTTPNAAEMLLVYNSAASGSPHASSFINDNSGGSAIVATNTASSGQASAISAVTVSSAGGAVNGVAISSTGSTTGVRGESDSPAGYGVTGVALPATGGTGVYAVSFGSGGTGLNAQANSSSGNSVGVMAGVNSPTGTGLLTSAFGSTGAGLALHAVGYSASGNAAFFESPGADAVLVNNTGNGRGMHVTTTHDTALWAEAGAGLAGVDARSSLSTGFGVIGQALATSGVNYGVRGNTSSSSGFGVYSAGNFGASGTKAFRIDHPADPTHKYLFHYCTESPEVLNAYRGTVILNQQGEATVDLPAYFARINTNPSYQLTPVGAAMPLLHVSQEISADALAQGEKAAPADTVPTCSFTISGGAPNAKVCWRVEAARNDIWVQTHGAPVEVNKEGPEDGTYQHPELYGRPAERGMNAGTPTR